VSARINEARNFQTALWPGRPKAKSRPSMWRFQGPDRACSERAAARFQGPSSRRPEVRRLYDRARSGYQLRHRTLIKELAIRSNTGPTPRLGFTELDKQLRQYADQLQDLVKLAPAEVAKVATLVAADVRFLEPAARSEIINSSPVPLKKRVEELVAFQAWTEIASGIRGNPAITRAQVITQNYVCFVYLPETCFLTLRKSQSGSLTRRCCKSLTDNPIRAFRNAIAHSNWTYSADFGGLVYWARKGQDDKETLTRFEVTQADLDFWQALAKGVAYAAYSTLTSVGE
jgi:hypothetical protein